MNIEELKKLKTEKETQKIKIEAVFHQLIGQIILLEELINSLEKK